MKRRRRDGQEREVVYFVPSCKNSRGRSRLLSGKGDVSVRGCECPGGSNCVDTRTLVSCGDHFEDN